MRYFAKQKNFSTLTGCLSLAMCLCDDGRWLTSTLFALNIASANVVVIVCERSCCRLIVAAAQVQCLYCTSLLCN